MKITPLSHLHDKTGQLKPIKCAATTHAKEKHLDHKVQPIRFGPNKNSRKNTKVAMAMNSVM